MQWIYSLAVGSYGLFIRVAALFLPKAAQWVQGRKNWEQKLADQLQGKPAKRIWFHCPSLGEFEQGRPVLEQIRKEYPEHCIVLSFFSPSGYNVRKNEPLADIVTYLPLDSARNSRRFICLLNPSLVFFVKYDFWYWYGKILHEQKIPFFCVSASFRPGQIFFKSWAKFFRKILTRYSHIFVQDQSSLELLYKNAIPGVTVSGDTRFDRVLENSARMADFPTLQKFAEGSTVMVAGSTWAGDEKVLLGLLQSSPDLKLIIAPHEIHETAVRKMQQRFGGALRFTEASADKETNARVMIIDTIGLLSLIYRFGKYTYVGGGFGKGIHNVLEAAVYGKPVFFGPNFKKFREARDLKAMGCGILVKRPAELIDEISRLEANGDEYTKLATKSRKYIEDRKGATAILMNYLRLNYQG
jgi:3-deoxy-D-manno-octulosonic-acid transferase